MPIETTHHDVDPDDPAATQAFDDRASYGTVRITLGNDPDNPKLLATTVDLYHGAPCFREVASALRDIADEFDNRHGEKPCTETR